MNNGRVSNSIDIGELVHRYESGVPMKQLCQELGIANATCSRLLRNAGARPSKNTTRITEAWKHRPRVEIPNMEEIARRYEAGESLVSLAREVGIGRYAMETRLRDVGAQIRTPSQAEHAKWASGNIDIARQCGPAWQSWRGRHKTDEHKASQTRTREKRLSCRGAYEDALAEALQRRGISIRQQRAVGPYNVDIAIEDPPIAIEITTGGAQITPNVAGPGFLKRSADLIEWGWVVLRVHALTFFDADPLADYIVGLRLRVAGDPTLRGRYAVIRGNGEPLRHTRSQLDQLPQLM